MGQNCVKICVHVSDLQHCHQHHQCSYGVHDASIVGQQGVAAAFLPHIELLGVVVVTVVGRIVCHLVLNAGSWGTGVTAAERHSIHQILAVHIAPNATKKTKCCINQGKIQLKLNLQGKNSRLFVFQYSLRKLCSSQLQQNLALV